MTWYRVDDGFADHPKVLRCSLAAIGLWVKAGAWSAKHLTDGAVPKGAVSALGGTAKLAGELVAACLWHETEDGYAFHEWLEHQPSRSNVLAKRDATKARVAAHRSRSNGARNAVTGGVTNAAPVPSRPEPAAVAAAAAPPGSVSVGAAEACQAWHAAMQQAGAITSLHAEHAWRQDYETIAAACNAVDGDRQLAVRAVCQWFWLAPDGPVQRLAMNVHRVHPDTLAKRVSSDLHAASAWLASQEAAQ